MDNNRSKSALKLSVLGWVIGVPVGLWLLFISLFAGIELSEENYLGTTAITLLPGLVPVIILIRAAFFGVRSIRERGFDDKAITALVISALGLIALGFLFNAVAGNMWECSQSIYCNFL